MQNILCLRSLPNHIRMTFFEDHFIKCIVCNELDRKLKIHDGHHYVCLSCIRKMYQSVPLRCPLCCYDIIENLKSNDIILRIDALVVEGAEEKAEKLKLMHKADLLLRRIELLESKKRPFSSVPSVDCPVDSLIDHPEDRVKDRQIKCAVDFSVDCTVNRNEDRPKKRLKDRLNNHQGDPPVDLSRDRTENRTEDRLEDLPSLPRPDILMANINVPASCPTPAISNKSSKQFTIKASNHCSICSKQFRRPSDLERHKSAMHMGKRPFQCPECEKSYVRMYDLTRHSRIHSGEKPFQCQVCDKSFFFANELKRHLRIHTGEKPFRCQVCNKSFKRSCHVTRHMRTHSGEKPFQYKNN